jgi:imidazoleglycerol-phosphate dehydratase
MSERKANIERKTKETDIKVKLNIDGHGDSTIQTGIAFLDHMLALFAKHGIFDLEVVCKGDLEVDAHHSVEDIGICLGLAFEKALGEKKGIARFAHSYYPMDEALVRSIVDLSGRPFLIYHAKIQKERVGKLDAELVEEFWRAFVTHARVNLHIELLYGRNAHHVFEAVYKATGRALGLATRMEPRMLGVPSTKGVL